MSILIRQATILTMQDGQSPFTGDIRIVGNRIAEIASHIAPEPEDDVINGQNKLAMPGLVNAHQHSPMSLLRGFSDDLKLMDWLERKMLPAEARMTPEDIYWGSKLAIAEMIRSGTTAFADMYIHMNEIAEAVTETGIRASLTRGMVFMEDDGGRRLQEAVDLVQGWSGKANGRITTMYGPHSPYTCPMEPLREVITMAVQDDIPLHIHLAETKEEVEKIRNRYHMTPTEYLEEAGMFERAHVLLAHAVHLNSSDISRLKQMNGGIAHNPVSNLKLGCGIAPVEAMMAEGITVGIGTDGAGSATTLDMFEEMKAACWLQKLDYEDPTRLPARKVLHMATRGSAELLDIQDDVGILAAGYKADVILVDLAKPHLQPIHDVEALLAYGVNGSDVHTTIVDGQILMRDRTLLTMNEEEIYREVNARTKRIVKGI
ncbi:5-methylthioadenosine/S-adenosylhomocysteine deaminase [Paenibacillus sp. JJ-100]|uniref:amidohydrolase n=1 Tax=Paenibacillus sp. JJ-100 TaxID=2974896 RepID=UPI0022FFA7DE|nr:amidohydrolase [Paenibacillus sp. JJ-100]CAI6039942.1 5-methylthioadenosine/S-adenosylhomocysteine deaminase [Paenibacillus sp. JJ-100]